MLFKRLKEENLYIYHQIEANPIFLIWDKQKYMKCEERKQIQLKEMLAIG